MPEFLFTPDDRPIIEILEGDNCLSFSEDPENTHFTVIGLDARIHRRDTGEFVLSSSSAKKQFPDWCIGIFPDNCLRALHALWPDYKFVWVSVSISELQEKLSAEFHREDSLFENLVKGRES